MISASQARPRRIGPSQNATNSEQAQLATTAQPIFAPNSVANLHTFPDHYLNQLHYP